MAKGVTMGAFGLWVVSTVIWHTLRGTLPSAFTMGAVGFAAIWPRIKAVAQANNCIPHMLEILNRLIENEFGDLPLAALEDRRIRGEFKVWRDRFANTPRKADYVWTTLARILSFSKDRGLIASNPCEGGGRFYAADRTDKVWRDEDVAAFLAIAAPELALAMMLALWTGQRQGDLLRLPWSGYDGSHIRLRQSKTGRRVTIPVGEPLRILLDRTERQSPVILATSRGTPWTSDGFRTSWRKACAKAGITGLTFHDLARLSGGAARTRRCDRAADRDLHRPQPQRCRGDP